MGDAGPGAWSQGWARGRALEGGSEGGAPASRFGASRAERARIRFASRLSGASLAQQAQAPGNLGPASGRVTGQIWTKRELSGRDGSAGGGSGADTGREGAWSGCPGLGWSRRPLLTLLSVRSWEAGTLWRLEVTF